MIDTPVQPDVTTVQTVNNPPLVPTDPTSMLTAMVTPLVAPLVQDAATTAATNAVQPVQASVDAKHAESLAAISALQSVVSAVEQEVLANKAAIEAAVGRVGTAVVTRVEEDPQTQRVIVYSVVGAAIAGALIVLVAALLGNSTANHYIASVPAVAAALVLWLSRTALPTLPAKPVTPAK